MNVAALCPQPVTLGDALIAHARDAIAGRPGLATRAGPPQEHAALAEPGATFTVVAAER